MWVADRRDNKVYAYDLASKEWVPAKDFNTLEAAGNDNPQGIWSNGTTMWVADDVDRSRGKIYAYDMASKARIPAKEFKAGNDDPTGIWSGRDDGVGGLTALTTRFTPTTW